jgi:hypothetical protein
VFRFCDDGVLLLESGLQMANAARCFLTYIQDYYGGCYTKNKSKIYEFFLNTVFFWILVFYPLLYICIHTKLNFRIVGCVDMIKLIVLHGDVYYNKLVRVK